MEADYAAYLDSEGIDWEYEPECFANSDGQWLPDFRLDFDAATSVFTEVKPAGPLRSLEPPSLGFGDHVDAVLRRMQTAWASDPRVNLSLVFWDYGGPEYFTVYANGLHHPWLARSANDRVPMIWIGMGQLDRVTIPPGPGITCSIKPGRWWCSCGFSVTGNTVKPADVCAHLRALGSSPAVDEGV